MSISARVKNNSTVRVSTVQIGGTSIVNLSDVLLTNPLQDASLLVYNSAASKWENQILSGGATITNTGVVTINYPQSISSSSSPTFAGITINGPESVNGTLNVNGSLNASPSITSGSVTLSGKAFYVNTGGNVTWTLPSVASSLGAMYFVKNRGSGNATLTPSGSDFLYYTSPISSYLIRPGEGYILTCDGSFWNVM
jgi:hypothetical protein